MAKEKILIVEDDADIVEMISYNLKKEGYSVISVLDGERAVYSAKRDKPDLIILDLMLPGMDGLEVCRNMRKNELTAHIPIIMLTAKSQEADKVIGLGLGADDYMTKPFSPRELIARIKAVLRRGDVSLAKKIVKVGGIFIDSLKYKVTVSGKAISLTPTEFKLLEFMAQRPGIVLSRDKILDNVFGYEASIYDRTVDAHMKSLRKKLGKAREYIETIRGAGYRFKEL
ncbi:MAG TPA: response regulator [Candidatus Omnitrophica bacterium]|nr:response regulator [Candidatus Omnitrophota bacterium]